VVAHDRWMDEDKWSVACLATSDKSYVK